MCVCVCVCVCERAQYASTQLSPHHLAKRSWLCQKNTEVATGLLFYSFCISEATSYYHHLYLSGWTHVPWASVSQPVVFFSLQHIGAGVLKPIQMSSFSSNLCHQKLAKDSIAFSYSNVNSFRHYLRRTSFCNQSSRVPIEFPIKSALKSIGAVHSAAPSLNVL